MGMQPEALEDDSFAKSVREAALAAMADQGLTDENWPVEPAEGEHPAPTNQVSDEPAPAAGDEAGTGEPETPSEGTDPAAAEEIPTEYFGVDLSDLPPEKRSEVIAALQQRDTYIQSVQRENAKLKGEPGEAQPEPAPAAEPVPEPLSDDDIMRQLGYDPDDEMYEIKKEVALPLAKMLMGVAQKQQESELDRQIAAFESYWDNTLDALEEQHGKLPISRDELIEIAEKHEIFDPVDAYSRVMVSGRTNVEALKAEALKTLEATKPAPATTPPSTTRPAPADTKPAGPPVLMDPKEAALAAAKATGFDWGDTLKSMT